MFIYMYMRLICVGEYVYMYVCVYTLTVDLKIIFNVCCSLL